MAIPESAFFGGSERLEPFGVLGRLIRKGAPAALAVSDLVRVHEAIACGDVKLARDYIAITSGTGEQMIAILSEFDLACPAAVARKGLDVNAASSRAFDLWKEAVLAAPELSSHPDTPKVMASFRPAALSASAVERFREDTAAGRPTIATALCEGPARALAVVDAALAAHDRDGAREAFDAYYATLRLRHDLLIELNAVYLTTCGQIFGQQAQEEILYDAFTTCQFYEGLWQLMFRMTPREVAAFLADHLRAHFAGPDRGGSTGIVEEADRFRLIFAPCGSGGAMRLRANEGGGAGALPMAKASPHTWGRAGEVSGFCSHCAINELESVRRLGYPLFVTEFNPDPAKPCGWTIYKDPSAIPRAYFDRIGATRDPARFTHLPASGTSAEPGHTVDSSQRADPSDAAQPGRVSNKS